MRPFRQIFLISTVLCAVSHAASPVPSPVQGALQKIDAAIKPDQYETARTDLDNDGRDDVLALMNAKSSYTGTGGSTLFIFKNTGKILTSLGSVKVVNAPVYLSSNVTNGSRDLIATVRGTAPGLTTLTFDGKNYQPGAGEANTTLKADDKLLFAEPLPPFDQTAILHGISFKVSSPNLRSANTVTLTPGGLEIDNKPITIDLIGTITRIETADLDEDGSPEIYIYAHDGEGTNLIAYSTNKKKSLSQIFLPDLNEVEKNSNGYRGHDEFAVVENSLARRFPIFPEDPGDSKPTGKMRQLEYKLHPGEAGWLLKLEKTSEL